MSTPSNPDSHQSQSAQESSEPRPDLSVVVPIYNEVENLLSLRASIGHALDDGPWTYEVVLVDDASTDGSRKLYQEMLRNDPRLRVVLFRGNCGQTAAMGAGFKHSRGDIIVTMDGDLQNDPADIPRMIELLENHDIVCGWRRERKDRALTRLLPSKIANLLISSWTGVWVHDTGCSLKAYRGWVVRSLTLYSDMHRFIAALSVGVGARITELPVRHHARRFGVSKYGLTRIFKVTIDLFVVKMLIQFSERPVHWFCLMALFPFLLTWVLIFYGMNIDLETFEIEPKYDIVLVSAAAVSLLVALNLPLLGLLAELQLKSSGFARRRIELVRGAIVR